MLVFWFKVVTALSKDGRVVPGGKDGLERPVGIAIDEDGSILVTSSASEQLMKFNKDWTLAKAVGQKGDHTHTTCTLVIVMHAHF